MNGRKVTQRQCGSSQIDLLTPQLTAQSRCNFEVNDLRCDKAFAPKSCPSRVTASTIIGQCCGQNARVNDYHVQHG
jgi:hypothetical protein